MSPAQVVAYGSGNLAQVYFDLYPRRIALEELETAFPGMIDALVMHEGIGVVAGYLDADTPVVLGKGGRRNLHTGEVTGTDPLLPYAGDVALRAWQVGRVMDFPHAGDLMVVEHPLSRRHRGGPGGAHRQPRRHGRRADRCVPAPPR